MLSSDGLDTGRSLYSLLTVSNSPRYPTSFCYHLQYPKKSWNRMVPPHILFHKIMSSSVLVQSQGLIFVSNFGALFKCDRILENQS